MGRGFSSTTRFFEHKGMTSCGGILCSRVFTSFELERVLWCSSNFIAGTQDPTERSLSSTHCWNLLLVGELVVWCLTEWLECVSFQVLFFK